MVSAGDLKIIKLPYLLSLTFPSYKNNLLSTVDNENNRL